MSNQRYVMGIVVEADSADTAWELGATGAEDCGVFIGDPVPIAEQDEYTSREVADALLAAHRSPQPEAGDMSTSDGLGGDAGRPVAISAGLLRVGDRLAIHGEITAITPETYEIHVRAGEAAFVLPHGTIVQILI